MKNWANQILDEMISIAGLLDNKTTDFSSIIRKLSIQIADPEQTLSAMLLNKILTEKMDFGELGRTIGNDIKITISAWKHPKIQIGLYWRRSLLIPKKDK